MPPHFFPHHEAEEEMLVLLQIEDYEGDRSHPSLEDAWSIDRTDPGDISINVTITNFDFQ